VTEELPPASPLRPVARPRTAVIWVGDPDLGADGLEHEAPGSAEALGWLVRREAAALHMEAEVTRPVSITAAARLASSVERDAVVVVTGPGTDLTRLPDALDGVRAAAVAVVEPIGAGGDFQAARETAGRPNVLRGRGIDAVTGALRHVAATLAHPAATHLYSDGPEHAADLRIPASPGAHPVAVLLHGGFWYPAWQRDQMDRLAVDLLRRGWATWNVEYRRIGTGGGWPAPLHDVVAAVRYLSQLRDRAVRDATRDAARLDLDRAVLIGHSAGAHLAVLAARQLSEDAPPDPPTDTAPDPLGDVASAAPAPRIRTAASMAGVLDLEWARTDPVGADAVQRLFDDEAARHDGDPVRRTPVRVPMVVAQTDDDTVVPRSQTERFVAAARAAGDRTEELFLTRGGHFGWLDPTSAAWQELAERLNRAVR
jgi:acetyl esterase/lipase